MKIEAPEAVQSVAMKISDFVQLVIILTIILIAVILISLGLVKDKVFESLGSTLKNRSP